MNTQLFYLLHLSAVVFGISLSSCVLCLAYALSIKRRGLWAGAAIGTITTVMSAATWWAIFVRYSTV